MVNKKQPNVNAVFNSKKIIVIDFINLYFIHYKVHNKAFHLKIDLSVYTQELNVIKTALTQSLVMCLRRSQKRLQS